MTRRRRLGRDRLSDSFSEDYFDRWGTDDPADQGTGLGLRPDRRGVPSPGLRPWWWWIARLFR